MSVGSSLKEMRKSAGFTVDQLSARTRIPTSVIEDLERDNFSTCGGPTYARGHIRTIARICGVGDSEVLLAFEIIMIGFFIPGRARGKVFTK